MAAALISVESKIRILTQLYLSGSLLQGHNVFFELYGFDILIDSNLRAWLIEVNTCPSLATPSTLDFRVKYQLVSDMMHMLGIPNKKINRTEKHQAYKIRKYNKWFIQLPKFVNQQCIFTVSINLKINS